MPAPQTYSNHVRFDPQWHYIIVPALLINLVLAIVATVRDWHQNGPLCLWWVIMSLVLLLAVGRARVHSLTVQDRLIRLEEYLRYARVLSPSQRAAADGLALRQIIALRFASDAELPSLVDRALAEKLTPAQIKKAIANWRPDVVRA